MRPLRKVTFNALSFALLRPIIIHGIAIAFGYSSISLRAAKIHHRVNRFAGLLPWVIADKMVPTYASRRNRPIPLTEQDDICRTLKEDRDGVSYPCGLSFGILAKL